MIVIGAADSVDVNAMRMQTVSMVYFDAVVIVNRAGVQMQSRHLGQQQRCTGEKRNVGNTAHRPIIVQWAARLGAI